MFLSARGRSFNLGQDSEVKVAYSSNNSVAMDIYICWSLLGESKSVTTRPGLGSGNTPLTNTSLSWLIDVSYRSDCNFFQQLSGNTQNYGKFRG
jgi:hypothetical protein